MSTFKECEVTPASKQAGLHATEQNKNFRQKISVYLLQRMYKTIFQNLFKNT